MGAVADDRLGDAHGTHPTRQAAQRQAKGETDGRAPRAVGRVDGGGFRALAGTHGTSNLQTAVDVSERPGGRGATGIDQTDTATATEARGQGPDDRPR